MYKNNRVKMNCKIHIPINETVRLKLEKLAKKQGRNLSEVIREGIASIIDIYSKSERLETEDFTFYENINMKYQSLIKNDFIHVYVSDEIKKELEKISSKYNKFVYEIICEGIFLILDRYLKK